MFHMRGPKMTKMEKKPTRPRRGRPPTAAPEDKIEKGVNFKATDEERQLLKKLAKGRGISVSEMLREAFLEYLEDFGHRLLILRLPDKTFRDLTKVAGATDKNAVLPLIMEAINRYI